MKWPCSHSKKNLKKFNISSEEYVLLEKFFRNFFIYEKAIYTLVGSKPLTQIHLHYYDESNITDEERKKIYYILLNRSNKKDMIFYKSLSKETRKKARLIPEKDFIYSTEELWDKWEKIQHRFPLSKKFLIVKKERMLDKVHKFDPKCKKIFNVIFVNILQTALILQENYELFKQAVGFDFDPLSIIFELENEHSDFWNRLEGPEHCILWGLLYGFGKENSYGYQWKWKNIKKEEASAKEKSFTKIIHQHSSNKNRISRHSITDFLIPTFTSFSDNDSIVVKYQEERKYIQYLYKRKDFVDFTLELLTTD